MFGNGNAAEVASDTSNHKNYIMRSEVFTATATNTSAASAGWSDKYVAGNGKQYAKLNAKFYEANENASTKDAVAAVSSFENGKSYYCTYDLSIEGSVIDINADTFPGTCVA